MPEPTDPIRYCPKCGRPLERHAYRHFTVWARCSTPGGCGACWTLPGIEPHPLGLTIEEVESGEFEETVAQINRDLE